MPNVLLAVGMRQACDKLILAAVAGGWSVLHTIRPDDVPEAFTFRPIDIVVVVEGVVPEAYWSRDTWRAWSGDRDVPVVMLGSHERHHSLILALVNGSGADRRGESRALPLSPTLTLFEPVDDECQTRIREAITYIEAHFADPITLADAAGAACYSRCHFSKLFKEQVGMSFIAYLTRVRIGHAARLLAHSERPITDIAFEVGFNDLSHFERVFRSVERLSPSQYRREAKKTRGISTYKPGNALLAAV